jgi:signal transduction histidine kinase
MPRSLFGRVAMILFGALALAHGLTYLAILRERGDLAQNMMLAYLGRDVASAVAILDRVPAAERAQWLPRLERQNYRYALREAAQSTALAGELPRQLSQVVAAQVGAQRVGTMTLAAEGWQLPLRLADGSPLTLSLHPPQRGVSRGTLWLLLAQLAALALAAWVAVRLATRALTRLADAADALGHGAHVPLPEQGPQEVARAARAFNALQQRIADHIGERVHTLAAISHDLQSPLTRMRLRTELLPEGAARDRLLGDLAQMQALVAEGLAYARTAHASQEAPRAVDLHALLDSLVCEATDAGQRAHLRGQLSRPVVTRPQALRRVVGNLLDNALKFGGEAEVLFGADGNGDIHVAVRDPGPGIPPAQLEAVMQPFVRAEPSRNRDTGGTGLGLSIASQLAAVLGGHLRLTNLPEGGFEARLSLPLPEGPGRSGGAQ